MPARAHRALVGQYMQYLATHDLEGVLMIVPQRDGQKIGPVCITPEAWNAPHGYKGSFERCKLARESELAVPSMRMG